MKRAFTLIEIVVALTICMILAVLILSVVSAARFRGENARCLAQMQQLGHALQLYTADYDGTLPAMTDAAFVANQASSPITWRTALQTYLSNSPFPACPAVVLPAVMQQHKGETPVCGYAYNGYFNSETRIASSGATSGTVYTGRSEAALNYSALTVAVLEARPGILACRTPDVGSTLYGIWASNFTREIAALPDGARRHHNGANYLFADGHVKRFAPEKLSTGRTSDGIHPGFGL